MSPPQHIRYTSCVLTNKRQKRFDYLRTTAKTIARTGSTSDTFSVYVQTTDRKDLITLVTKAKTVLRLGSTSDTFPAHVPITDKEVSTSPEIIAYTIPRSGSTSDTFSVHLPTTNRKGSTTSKNDSFWQHLWDISCICASNQQKRFDFLEDYRKTTPRSGGISDTFSVHVPTTDRNDLTTILTTAQRLPNASTSSTFSVRWKFSLFSTTQGP